MIKTDICLLGNNLVSFVIYTKMLEYACYTVDGSVYGKTFRNIYTTVCGTNLGAPCIS